MPFKTLEAYIRAGNNEIDFIIHYNKYAPEEGKNFSCQIYRDYGDDRFKVIRHGSTIEEAVANAIAAVQNFMYHPMIPRIVEVETLAAIEAPKEEPPKAWTGRRGEDSIVEVYVPSKGWTAITANSVEEGIQLAQIAHSVAGYTLSEGDRVVCIDADAAGTLINGAEYTILSQGTNHVYLKELDGEPFYSTRFRVAAARIETPEGEEVPF